MRQKANDNQWYWALTVFGEPDRVAADPQLHARNKEAWQQLQAGSNNYAADLEKRAGRGLTLTPHDMAQASVIDLSNVEFPSGLLVDEFEFHKPVIFDGSIFKARAGLRAARFHGGATFESAMFESEADVEDAVFAPRKRSSMQSVEFGGEASFRGAHFGSRMNFSAKRFAGAVRFDGAEFREEVDFSGRDFVGDASFDGATFRSRVSFAGAAFHAAASFVNVETRAPADFDKARFLTLPPEFFGSDLHSGTVLPADAAAWPLPKDGQSEPQRFVLAYVRLKSEMERLKNHNDELRFLALELGSRQRGLGFGGGRLHAAYDALSRFGQSYAVPLVHLVALWAAGADLFWLFNGPANRAQAFRLSLENTFSVLSFLHISDRAVSTPHAGWVAGVAVFQGVFGAILLFLVGLGIRNRFRMK